MAIHSFFLPKQSKESQHMSANDDEEDFDEFAMTLSALASEESFQKKKRLRKEKPCINKHQSQVQTNASAPESSSSFSDSAGAEESVQQMFKQTHSHAKPSSQARPPAFERVPTSKSLLNQLLARSTTGKVSLTHNFDPKWSRCSWIHLPCQSTPTAMAFDQDGILFAVAMGDRSIHIWDWDMVIASDFQGRLDHQNDIVPPVLIMTVPFPCVSHLGWHNDSLAVTFRGASVIHVYDMLVVSNEPSNPSAACTVLKPPSHVVVTNQGPKCISFLPDCHFVAAYPCGHVCLWSISTQPTLSWVWKNAEPMSCIQPIARNLILFGGMEGSFVILDWRKTTRRAFASEKSPTVMSTWITAPSLRKRFPTVKSRDWGVQTVQLDGIRSITPNVTIDNTGPCALSWITAGGWLLSMNSSPTSKLSPKILYSPPAMETFSLGGSNVVRTTDKFSSIGGTIAATSNPFSTSGALMVWHMVPQVTHILPPHDNRVCQQRQIEVSSDRLLACISVSPDKGKRRFTTTLLQKLALKSQPKIIAIHGSNEWIIVATESTSNLLVYNARVHPAR